VTNLISMPSFGWNQYICQTVLYRQLHAKSHMSTVFIKCHMYVDNGQKEDSQVNMWRFLVCSASQELQINGDRIALVWLFGLDKSSTLTVINVLIALFSFLCQLCVNVSLYFHFLFVVFQDYDNWLKCYFIKKEHNWISGLIEILQVQLSIR